MSLLRVDGESGTAVLTQEPVSRVDVTGSCRSGIRRLRHVNVLKHSAQLSSTNQHSRWQHGLQLSDQSEALGSVIISKTIIIIILIISDHHSHYHHHVYQCPHASAAPPTGHLLGFHRFSVNTHALTTFPVGGRGSTFRSQTSARKSEAFIRTRHSAACFSHCSQIENQTISNQEVDTRRLSPIRLASRDINNGVKKNDLLRVCVCARA